MSNDMPMLLFDVFHYMFLFSFRLQERLEALDDESTELMEDWREKCSILKSGMDAADKKIAEGKKAESHDEIENSYKMLKVMLCFISRKLL